MENGLNIEDCFDDNGTIKQEVLDQKDLFSILFDEYGFLRPGVDKKLQNFAEKNKLSYWSDVVGLVHAEKFANNTKDNYPTNYYFR